ncbi:TIGR01777 family oxidoreductase [Aureicoccus marinus]|uniref:TIGR01777 family protein n=1 Tax=Aureicoccus marinus TaxID=754435 RepID=A0A2S7T569_9FLAO|nr:TIGR01777 family oxidoreductase [Aureicoccus marinus]PQJ14596.1 TIGR01777 family protein [Aureicoccus marinus]
MKVLITGATGLVGTALRKHYEEKGIEVHYLTTSNKKIGQGYGSGFLWNPRKKEMDLQAFEGVTHLVNLAGASIAQRWTSKNRKSILNSRIDSLSTLNEALKQLNSNKIEHFLTASAIGIYPNSYSTEYREEHAGVDNSFLGEVVEAWEKAVQPFDAHAFPVSILRIGIVLDAEEGALPKLVQPIVSGVGAPLGSGRQWQSWIHIQDLVGIIIHAQKHTLSGVYNGVAPQPVRQKELTRAVAKSLGKKIWLPPVPSFVLRLMLGEMAYIALASQRVSAEKILQTGYAFTFDKVQPALDSLLPKN